MEKYETPLYEDEKLLNKFLDIWTIPNIERMTLEEYTDVDNRFTFTQWVEGRTKPLGSIKAIFGSAKFGIYKKKSSKKLRGVFSNDTYTWIKYYGECNFDEQEVFKKVKKELLLVINYAQQLDFKSIEGVNGFYELYKWKVAFLYSNQSMIPVFNQKLLIRFTKDRGMQHTSRIEYAKMHRYLYNHKSPNQSVFNFMRKLFHDADIYDKKDKSKILQGIKKGRKEADELNTDDHERKGTKATMITQYHKIFQKQLMIYLKNKYPSAKIVYEKNYIDLLLTSDKEVHYYEVKTAQTPQNCIKQGLGQLLNYSFYEENVLHKYKGLKKKIIIFGRWKPTEQDLDFISYVNKSLRINFGYLSIEEIES